MEERGRGIGKNGQVDELGVVGMIVGGRLYILPVPFGGGSKSLQKLGLKVGYRGDDVPWRYTCG